MGKQWQIGRYNSVGDHRWACSRIYQTRLLFLRTLYNPFDSDSTSCGHETEIVKIWLEYIYWYLRTSWITFVELQSRKLFNFIHWYINWTERKVKYSCCLYSLPVFKCDGFISENNICIIIEITVKRNLQATLTDERPNNECGNGRLSVIKYGVRSSTVLAELGQIRGY